MPDKKGKTSLFIKDEASYSPTSGTLSDYLGVGAKYSSDSVGTIEGMLAFKASNLAIGSFGEIKYTTPKLEESNWAVESRTRVILEKPYDEGDSKISLTERVSAKGSWNLNNSWNIYEIAGVNSKFSLQKGDLKSLSPTSITGVGYNLSPKASVYGEVELSQGFSFEKKSWDKFSPAVYLGVKIAF